MPELPEVETIKRYLEKAIVGKKIVDLKVLSKRQFWGEPKEIIGAKITGLERRAKYLILKLSDGKNLLIHLKLTGQLVWTPGANADLPGKTTRIIIRFNKGTLFFNDMRKFGWIKVVGGRTSHTDLDKLGPEPFGKDFSVDYLKQVFRKTSRPIKLVLLDQEKIAGIGNIYANEALFEAGINPEKPAKNLSPKEIKKLRKAILLVLKQGIKYEGSSAADEAYIKPDASRGKYQEHFRVYQKDGKECSKCATINSRGSNSIIKRITLGGRGTFFCPKCQK